MVLGKKKTRELLHGTLDWLRVNGSGDVARVGEHSVASHHDKDAPLPLRGDFAAEQTSALDRGQSASSEFGANAG